VHDVIEKQLSSRAGGVAHQNEEVFISDVINDIVNFIVVVVVVEFEHVLILSLANNDNEVDESRMVIVDDNNELMRRAVRTNRGVNNGTKRFTSQSPTTTSNTASPQKSAAGCFIADRRKQRGRRRARGGSATSATVTTSNMNSKDQSQQQIDDIYEFRSSPESDININKSVSDMTVASLSNREMSAPPAAKRQRISTAATTSSLQEELEIATEDLPSLGVVQGDEEQNEMSSTTSGCAVVIDEHGDDNSNNNKGVVSGRKVPPLRITLPRTPSEDGMVSSKGDGVTNTAEEAVVVSKDTQSNASTAN
ncbi:unnamed protein product, partial [Anisakis simplex]|uniref:Pecanex-like protein n=1 Tax=Anisakis simplex TaxID=6269 RepID=A0A0M3J597_ANISI